MPIVSNHEKLLANCIIESISENDFNWEIFFRLWFRDNGTPLYFLFKKNLGVTNTQYVELFSLLTIHSTCDFNDKAAEPKLLFYSTDHIKTTFSDAMATLLEDYAGNEIVIQKFSKRYIDVFGATVAVDMFYGSCAIFLPRGVKTDVEKLVFDSGYIHSAGRSIYVRNIKKAKKQELMNSLREYTLKEQINDPVPFVVYSHEDFSAFDKDHSDLMDRGIEQCKIYIEKMSMGSDRLSSIINELGVSFKEKFFVPKAGDYRQEHNFKQGKSVWLISDRSISNGQLKNPGSNRYYVCYEQFLKDDSPFFFFDENKPAWKSHTTMPHSLTAALLNTARPLSATSLICDPFGGTGTTWFEVKRLQLENEIRVSDLSPAAVLLIKDNSAFFGMSSEKLQKILDSIKSCVPTLAPANQILLGFDSQEAIDHYSVVRKLIDILKSEQPNEDQEFSLSADFIDRLEALPLLTRFLFYIGLRAELRFQSAFKRKSSTFEVAFKKSQEKLIEQINIFIDLKKEVELHLINHPQQDRSYIKSVGNYSYKLTPTSIFSRWLNIDNMIVKEVKHSFDARELRPNSCELIICDPPYGFNTIEDEEELANLYSEFLDKAIAALIPKGQLILCLPSESYTGKSLPYCTRTDLVSRQIIIKAHRQHRTVYSVSKSVPTIGFNPPYYWEAEKALRRSILHFRLL